MRREVRAPPSSASRSGSTIVERNKGLADIERGVMVMKSEIGIAPMFHRLPERIRAHASNCYMPLTCAACCASA